MYGGFAVDAAATDIVLIGNGPTLTGLNIPNALANPIMEVYDANGALLRSIDNWADDPVSAANMAPAYAAEPALHLTLNPGYYTFIVKGAQGSEGEAVINLYQR